MKPILASTLVALTLVFSTQQSAAEGSMGHSAAAVHHSAEGLGYASIAGAQVVSAGGGGATDWAVVSSVRPAVRWGMCCGRRLMTRARPLPVTDQVIQCPALRPDQALQLQPGR